MADAQGKDGKGGKQAAGGGGSGAGKGKRRRRGGGPRSGGGKGGTGSNARGGKGQGNKGRGKQSDGGKGGQQGQQRRAKPEDATVALGLRLQKVLARLPQTQRDVLELRMGLRDGHPHNLADTARELGISMSEARDIEQRAFAHIRDAVPTEHLQKFLGGK